MAADDPAAKRAADRAAELRAELARARDLHRDRKLSLDSLVGMEAWAWPEIEQCERAARPRHVPTAVWDLAEAPDVAAAWDGVPVVQRRTIVGSMLVVRLHKRAAPGPAFDPSTVTVRRR